MNIGRQHEQKMTPFGSPDGAVGPLEGKPGFVLLPEGHSPATRPVAEHSRVRVVSGTQGVGKTLLLRRLQAHFTNDESVHAAPPTLKARELDTNSVVAFSQLFDRTTNTEKWSILWDRAVHLSAATLLVHDAQKFGDVNADTLAWLGTFVNDYFPDAKTMRSPVEVAGMLVRSITSEKNFRKRMLADKWVELSHQVQLALDHSRELYLFVDAVDDNYRYAPTYWQQCQRGLFHAVMDARRTETEASKLHIVISVRDLTLSSVARGEHGTRYINDDSVLQLSWDADSCKEFLGRKIEVLDPALLGGREPTLAGLLGRDGITNTVRGLKESVDQYFLRHTRMSPRDVITTGNALVALSVARGAPINRLTDDAIRDAIAKQAKLYAKSALAQAGNQVLANVMPWNATRHNYADFYVSEDEYTADAMVREMSSVLLHANGERFCKADLEELDREAERRFGSGCRFTDVLWQNRLLGVFSDGLPIFYTGALTDDMSVPTAKEYGLNSLLVDMVPRLHLNASEPIFPRGRK